MATETRHKNDRAAASHPVHRTTGEPRAANNSRDWARDRDGNRSSFSPFSLMRQGLDEMERWFGHLGHGQSSSMSAGGMSQMGKGIMSQMGQAVQHMGDWMPPIEAFQRGNDFVVRAEVPGMNRQDLTVEVGDESLTIRGERRHEHEDEREGVFWTERNYGSFTRVIPLPPGTIADSAKASFHNGILEVVMQAPSAEARRGRRIDISGTSHDGDKK